MQQGSHRILVIGYGNPLRGDDGLGPAAAELLAATTEARVVACHQLTPELAEDLAGCDLAVFIDASTEAPPGQLATRPVAPAKAEPAGMAGFTHHLDPALLLAAAQILYGRYPQAFLISVGATGFDLGEGLSPAVAAALPAVAEAARRLIADFSS